MVTAPVSFVFSERRLAIVVLLLQGKKEVSRISSMATGESASPQKRMWRRLNSSMCIPKEAKLKNSAPIKYHIEIANRYWDGIFKAEAITDRKKQIDRVVEEKEKIINFLTGMENSGKALFSTFYVSPDGKEQHDVVIPAWHSSTVAELYKPKIFENKKKSGGFWF